MSTDRSRSLAAAASNFSFLKGYDSRLLQAVTSAARFTFEDPVVALMRLRQFGELLALEAAALVGIYTHPDESQVDLHRRLSDRGVLNRKVTREPADTEFKTTTQTTTGDDAIADSVTPNIPFAEMDNIDQSEAVWTILFGQGPLPRDEAIKNAAAELKEQGLTQFKGLRKDGSLWSAIDKAFRYGIRVDNFDRPKRGYVRAVLRNAVDYEPKDWERAVHAVVGDGSIDEEGVIRVAADWARDNMGLAFNRLRRDGVVYQKLAGWLQK